MESHSKPNNFLILGISSITLNETVTTAVLGVVLAVFMWGWTFVYDFLKIFLDQLPINYITSGFWLIPGIFIPFIFRKPGLGFFASILAAFVQGMITQWGLGAVIYGILQGLGAELVFMAVRYRKFSFGVLSVAAMASALLSYGYDFFKYEYFTAKSYVSIMQCLSFMLSGILFAVLPTFYLAKRLKRAGVLKQFAYGREL